VIILRRGEVVVGAIVFLWGLYCLLVPLWFTLTTGLVVVQRIPERLPLHLEILGFLSSWGVVIAFIVGGAWLIYDGFKVNRGNVRRCRGSYS